MKNVSNCKGIQIPSDLLPAANLMMHDFTDHMSYLTYHFLIPVIEGGDRGKEKLLIESQMSEEKKQGSNMIFPRQSCAGIVYERCRHKPASQMRRKS